MKKPGMKTAMNDKFLRTTRRAAFCLCPLFLCLLAPPAAWGQTNEAGSRWQRFREMRETQRENRESTVSEESLGARPENTRTDEFGGRDMLVYLPSTLPPKGQRSLLVALHGGGGNAEFMRDHLKINGVAERNGFMVAYLNGSAAARIGTGRAKAWNAGNGCCGTPNREKVDDIGYITGAVRYLQQKYGVAPQRSVGVGHSNGAMMMQTLACQSDLFSTVATLAGALMSDDTTYPAARGHTIYNYHGENDRNVPIAGGFGSKGVSNIEFTSQSRSKTLFEKAGGHYVLLVLPEADHSIEHLSESSQKQDGLGMGERIARDLGLLSD